MCELFLLISWLPHTGQLWTEISAASQFGINPIRTEWWGYTCRSRLPVRLKRETCPDLASLARKFQSPAWDGWFNKSWNEESATSLRLKSPQRAPDSAMRLTQLVWVRRGYHDVDVDGPHIWCNRCFRSRGQASSSVSPCSHHPRVVNDTVYRTCFCTEGIRSP